MSIPVFLICSLLFIVELSLSKSHPITASPSSLNDIGYTSNITCFSGIKHCIEFHLRTIWIYCHDFHTQLLLGMAVVEPDMRYPSTRDYTGENTNFFVFSSFFWIFIVSLQLKSVFSIITYQYETETIYHSDDAPHHHDCQGTGRDAYRSGRF